MLFCKFLTVFVVEMYCNEINEFGKHTMVQIHSNSLQTAFTRGVFVGFQFFWIRSFQKLFRFQKFRIHTPSVIILYWIHAR